MPATRMIYEGKVQGVGFRATVKGIARGYDVRGWVRNCPDGRVEMVVEADEPEELEDFLEGIAESVLKGHISRVERFAEGMDPSIRGFQIVA